MQAARELNGIAGGGGTEGPGGQASAVHIYVAGRERKRGFGRLVLALHGEWRALPEVQGEGQRPEAFQLADRKPVGGANPIPPPNPVTPYEAWMTKGSCQIGVESQ